MKIHELKTWPSYFNAVRDGIKRFEIRKNDRDFAVGDQLHLREFDPGKDVTIDAWKYTGRELWCRILYKMDGGRLGLDPHFCILSLEVINSEVIQ